MNVCKGLCSRLIGYKPDTHRTKYTKDQNFCSLCSCILPDRTCRCCKHRVRTTPSHVQRRRGRVVVPDLRKRIE